MCKQKELANEKRVRAVSGLMDLQCPVVDLHAEALGATTVNEQDYQPENNQQ